MSGGRVAVLIGLAPLLLQCNPERLLIVTVDPGEVVVPVAKLDARTSLDGFRQATLFDVANDAGRSQHDPVDIGIYHPRLTGVVTVMVHALANGQRVAGGVVKFDLTGGEIERVREHLELKPCIDPDARSPQELCGPMPSPNPDGGDGGVDGNAGDAGDAAGDAGDAGDGSTACPGSDVPALASVDAGVVPSECETYCAAAVSHCPDLFPRLPSPTPRTGDPAPIDICRLACLASRLADDTAPISALTCRTADALEADGGSASCILASLASPRCSRSSCIAYCQMYETICGPAVDCLNACAPVANGDILVDPAGDTLACRMVWLQRAMFDSTACAAAQLQPVCGSCRSDI